MCSCTVACRGSSWDFNAVVAGRRLDAALAFCEKIRPVSALESNLLSDGGVDVPTNLEEVRERSRKLSGIVAGSDSVVGTSWKMSKETFRRGLERRAVLWHPVPVTK